MKLTTTTLKSLIEAELNSLIAEQGGVPAIPQKNRVIRVRSAKRAPVYRKTGWDRLVDKIRKVPVIGKKLGLALSAGQVGAAAKSAYNSGGMAGLKDYLISIDWKDTNLLMMSSGNFNNIKIDDII